MENNELLKRGEDLARRCENKGCLTSTGFLTPAEQYALAHMDKPLNSLKFLRSLSAWDPDQRPKKD